MGDENDVARRERVGDCRQRDFALVTNERAKTDALVGEGCDHLSGERALGQEVIYQPSWLKESFAPAWPDHINPVETRSHALNQAIGAEQRGDGEAPAEIAVAELVGGAQGSFGDVADKLSRGPLGKMRPKATENVTAQISRLTTGTPGSGAVDNDSETLLLVLERQRPRRGDCIEDLD
jgi:hypothetical protein